ncbi:MAG: hypothetical protein IT535_15885 [Bauldia sp.]|nr:hypothetical protein [Bauldia sp.]
MATLKKPEPRTNAREESLREKVKSPSTGASSREPKTAAPISSRSPASEDKRKGVNERPVQLSYDASDDGYDEETRPAKVKPVRPSADPYDEDGELREIWERNQKTAAPRPSMSVIGPVAEDPLERELKKTWERMQAQPSAGSGTLFGAPPTPSSDWRGALASDVARLGSDPFGLRAAYGVTPGTQVAQAAPGAGQVLQNDAAPGAASTMSLAPEAFGERYFGTPFNGEAPPDWAGTPGGAGAGLVAPLEEEAGLGVNPMTAYRRPRPTSTDRGYGWIPDPDNPGGLMWVEPRLGQPTASIGANETVAESPTPKQGVTGKVKAPDAPLWTNEASNDFGEALAQLEANSPAADSGVHVMIGYTTTGEQLEPFGEPRHAVVVAVDLRTGEARVTRAGSGLWSSDPSPTNFMELVAEAGDWVKSRDYGMVLNSQYVGPVDLSLDEVEDRMREFADKTNRLQLNYLTNTSNAYAFTFVESLGLGRVTPSTGLNVPQFDRRVETANNLSYYGRFAVR